MKQQKYKTFIHIVARQWITEWRDMADSNTDDSNSVPSEEANTTGVFSRTIGGLSRHKLGEILDWGQGRKNTL